MKFFTKILGILSLSVILFSTGFIKDSKAYLTSVYGFSCTNVAYGTQLGNVYISAYAAVQGSASLADKGQGSYSGINCVYSGAGRTNS